MNFNRLRYFVALAETLHFGQAAERLHMAQPPLSQQIQRLEAELGLPLFDRTTRSVELTEAGQLLLANARNLLIGTAEFERRVEQLRTGEGGVLRIGFVDSASYGILPQFLRRYRARWPSVKYELRSLSSDQQLRALLDGDIDLGIARTAPLGSLVHEHVLKEPLLIAAPTDHPLAQRNSTTIRRAFQEQEDVIGFDRRVSPTLFDEFRKLVELRDLAYQPVIEATEYTTILGLVSAGEGIALVPASVQSFQPPNLRYLRLRDADARTQLVFCRREQMASPLLEHTRDVVTELFPKGRLPLYSPTAQP